MGGGGVIRLNQGWLIDRCLIVYPGSSVGAVHFSHRGKLESVWVSKLRWKIDRRWERWISPLRDKCKGTFAWQMQRHYWTKGEKRWQPTSDHTVYLEGWKVKLMVKNKKLPKYKTEHQIRCVMPPTAQGPCSTAARSSWCLRHPDISRRESTTPLLENASSQKQINVFVFMFFACSLTATVVQPRLVVLCLVGWVPCRRFFSSSTL